ncbi:hypothetical protein E3N88_28893 [Mikania micrantha]|uniref:Reverse transcriptase domain-containing protein n=1 Tax=Mikania micrantha TaxID=192012 RepID=A0A5N6N3P3_9ASTR|nr:hypothetical protein E3N88_28893 [Mikania micrantha]
MSSSSSHPTDGLTRTKTEHTFDLLQREEETTLNIGWLWVHLRWREEMFEAQELACVFPKMIETILRSVTQATANQFRFMPGRSTTKAIHVLRRLMEKYREKKKDLHMMFIDLEKAYNSVPRQLIWDSLESRGIPWRYIEIIRDTYASAKTSVRAPVGDTDFFSVE